MANAMRESLGITDGVYGIQPETGVRQRIAALGNGVASREDVQEIRGLVDRLLAKLDGISIGE